tara:strand:- start:1197 stop:1901 length:705 start_codon:yes stop_codon:yes gene_type:complete
VDIKNKRLAFRIYLLLAGLFISSLVVSNLIFQKFFYWYPLDFKIFGVTLFELSVGILPYPVTFLITDIISEIYGKEKATNVVLAGIFASIFSILIILIADALPTLNGSPIDSETFYMVFSKTPIAVFSSMLAYLFSQFIDIQIYHFWKKKTKGDYLWLRNNFSTFSSQIIDSFTVLFLLCFFEIIPWDIFYGLFISSVIFKVFIAFVDTPLLYFFVFLLRKTFKIKKTEEVDFY